MGRRTTWWHVVIVPVVLVALAGCEDLETGSGSAGRPGASTTTTATREATPEPSVAPSSPSSTPPATADPLISTGTVTEVVDGDTIKVDGQSVRLIGMDSPEAGQCGYDEATAAMADLVAGRVVTLTAVAGRDDVDRYGRLLRYVEVDGTDVGLREIELGLAIARYDGRDGYTARTRVRTPTSPPMPLRRTSLAQRPSLPLRPSLLRWSGPRRTPTATRRTRRSASHRRPPTSTAAISPSGGSRCSHRTRTTSTATTTGSAARAAEIAARRRQDRLSEEAGTRLALHVLVSPWRSLTAARSEGQEAARGAAPLTASGVEGRLPL